MHNGCFCCGPHSKEFDDKKVVEKIISAGLVPENEWELPWDPLLLHAETGSKKLTNFFLLRRVFLFLEVHTQTLLSVAGTCRSWRVLADRLPHWRYILPLRSEVFPIVAQMRFDQRPRFRRHYFHTDSDGVRHYKMVPNESFLKSTFSSSSKEQQQHDERGGGGCCCGAVKAVGNAIGNTCNVCCTWSPICDSDDCCDEDCCDDSSCCSSCSCSEDSDDREVEYMQSNRRTDFLGRENNRANLAEIRPAADDDAELATRAFHPHRRAVDWMKRLRVDAAEFRSKHRFLNRGIGIGIGGDGAAAAARRRRRQQHRRMESGSGDYEPLVDSNNVNAIAGYTDRHGDDDDDDTQFKNSPHHHHHHRRPQHRRRRGDGRARPAYAGSAHRRPPSAAIAIDDDTDDTDGTDTEIDTDTDDDRLVEQTSMRSVTFLNQFDRDENFSGGTDNTDNTDNGGGGGGGGGMLSGQDSIMTLSPDEVKDHKLDFITPVAALSWQERRRLSKEDKARPIRCRHSTLLEHSVEIMSGVSYRREWLFPSLSAFSETTREALRRFKKSGRVTCCEMWGVQFAVEIVCALLLVLSGFIAIFTSLHIEDTAWHGHQSDTVVSRNIALITISLSIVVLGGAWCFTMVHLDDYRRDVSFFKTVALIGLTSALALFWVPASLCAFRVNVATRLLDGGSISICDAFADMPWTHPPAALSNANSQTNSLQCGLPPQLLPTALAASTWVEFPPGTKLIFHPPSSPFLNGSRLVPFAATRASASDTVCTVNKNARVPGNDTGATMSRRDIDRGHPGYYSVIFPPRCNSGENSNKINNATFLIVGDFSECPFWSIDQRAHTFLDADKDPITNKTTHVFRRNVNFSSYVRHYLTNVLENPASVDDVIGNASLISEDLANALRARINITVHSNSSSSSSNHSTGYKDNATEPFVPQCSGAFNAMVTVRPNAPEPMFHRFFLRVASGFEPHWTASYYLARQPYDPSDDSVPGPWRERPRWTDTADYQLNGIVALMADSNIFLARHPYNTKAQQEQLSHHKKDANMPFFVPPFVGEYSDADGKKTAAAPFWTGATPAGIRKLRDDFEGGVIGLCGFIGGAFLVGCYLAILGRGVTRYALLFASALIVGVMVVPVPLLVIASFCFAHAALFDAAELTQPAYCLAASKHDIIGPFVYAVVVMGIIVLVFVGGICCCCCEEEECCEDCCDSDCDCCDCCECVGDICDCVCEKIGSACCCDSD